jgi:hypothetical protein
MSNNHLASRLGFVALLYIIFSAASLHHEILHARLDQQLFTTGLITCGSNGSGLGYHERQTLSRVKRHRPYDSHDKHTPLGQLPKPGNRTDTCS